MLLSNTGWWMRLSFSRYSCFQESLFSSSSLGWVFAFGTFSYWGFHFLNDLYGLFIHKTIIYFFAKSTFNRLLYLFMCMCIWVCLDVCWVHVHAQVFMHERRVEKVNLVSSSSGVMCFVGHKSSMKLGLISGNHLTKCVYCIPCTKHAVGISLFLSFPFSWYHGFLKLPRCFGRAQVHFSVLNS